MFARRSGGHLNAKFPELQADEVGITWIGHASFLLQTQTHNLLVDPNWAKWLKVIKRVRHPGLQLHDLPNIDLVLVTHAHFDHLDRKTLRSIAADQPIVVPFEVGNLVHDLGFRAVHELHYWEQFDCGPLKITLTPCHHWGARMLHDSHRGFGGFVIEGGGRTIFHCGDTAYFDGFAEIGQRHAIDVALLPIGAYAPRWFMADQHIDPADAVRIMLDSNARSAIGIHWGCFQLTDESREEPPALLAEALAAAGVAPQRFRAASAGDVFDVASV
jgi:L-ascorbate metabolism protein UlaG (beta-lactamase superfamily)